MEIKHRLCQIKSALWHHQIFPTLKRHRHYHGWFSPLAKANPCQRGIGLRCSRVEGNILKATSVTITHDIGSARKIATRVAMLYKGKIVWIGDVKNLDDPKDEILKQFIQGGIKGPIMVG